LDNREASLSTPKGSKTLLSIMLLAATAATAAHAGSNQYEIAATLLRDGKPFAAPHVTIRDGEPATVEVTGRDAFRLAITATGIDAESVRIKVDLKSAHGSMQPTMVVRTGEPARVAVGNLGLEIEVAREGAAGLP
jgi:hypothetical protein